MSTTFNLDVTEIVRQAYLRIGGEPITGQNARDARVSMNLLFIDLMNRGAPLAKVEFKTKPTVVNNEELVLDQEDVDVLDITVTDNGIDIPLTRISLFEYNQLPKKDQQGRPTQYTVDRQKDQTVLKLWPVGTQSYDINYYSIVRFTDVNGARDQVDFNFRYLPAIISGLAWYLSFNDAAFPLDKRQLLEARFEQDLERARVEDRERTSFLVVPFGYKGR